VRLVATSWGEADVAAASRAFEGAVRAAQDAARLAPGYVWAWDDADPLSPVHRLAHSAARLLTGDDLALLRCCDACCWLFLDRAGKGRKWCSMADCGTEAKKRRYVERRRRRRAAQ
jgi:predicted RNA-binding Zn ribbon-like protein